MGGQVEPPSGAGSRKRPIGVWIVLVWYAGSVLCSSLVFYLIFGGVVAIPPAQKAYFDSLTTLDYIFIIVEAVVSLSAAITLFLLRKWAVNLFAAAFGVIVVTTIWNVVARGWLFAIVEVPGAVDVYALAEGFRSRVVGLGITGVVWLYAWRLTKAGTIPSAGARILG